MPRAGHWFLGIHVSVSGSRRFGFIGSWDVQTHTATFFGSSKHAIWSSIGEVKSGGGFEQVPSLPHGLAHPLNSWPSLHSITQFEYFGISHSLKTILNSMFQFGTLIFRNAL